MISKINRQAIQGRLLLVENFTLSYLLDNAVGHHKGRGVTSTCNSLHRCPLITVAQSGPTNNPTTEMFSENTSFNDYQGEGNNNNHSHTTLGLSNKKYVDLSAVDVPTAIGYTQPTSGKDEPNPAI